MKTVRDKLYHYEEIPPSDIWEKVSDGIHTNEVGTMTPNRKRVKWAALATAAAAVTVLLLFNVVFFNKADHRQASDKASSLSLTHDSAEKNHELLESIIKAPENKKQTVLHSVSSHGETTYFLIEGPDGQPVKISPKVATLILSADDEYPPKPVWDKQIGQWQQIMLTNNKATSATASLLDIIQQDTKNIE